MRASIFITLILTSILLIPHGNVAAQDEWLTFEYFIDAELEPVDPIPADKIVDALTQAETTKDAETFYRLGRMYDESLGVKQNKVKAEKYLNIAAEGGLEKAQFALGVFYNFKGDITKARKWFSEAANKGNIKAMFQLGMMYELGRGSFQNNEKALEYYHMASDKGFLKATLRLALNYQHQAQPDFEKAIEFYKKAENQADDATRLKIVLLMAKLYAGIADIQGIPEEVFAWRMKAAELDDLESQTRVAQSYLNGTGTETDYEKAHEWFKKAADRGNTEAMTMLGYMYSNGLGVDINFQEAIRWYTYASERGNEEAAWSLGNMYLTGNGVKQNSKEAEKWFARAKILKKKNTKLEIK